MIPKDKVLVVTGAAGLIGGRLADSLIQQKYSVLCVDRLPHFENRPEQKQLLKHEKMDPNQFLNWFEAEGNKVGAVFHMGACTDTTETRWDYLRETNLEYSKSVWRLASRYQVTLVYASSAATYGEGEEGFSDNESRIPHLKPLNLYGKSKQDFDLWALEQERTGVCPRAWSGFKFFNVYGFGEAHKSAMSSVIFKAYHQILRSQELVLFKSHREGIQDGEQRRDFVAVEDVINVLVFAAAKPIPRGIFNLGTGQAQTFKELGEGVFDSLGKPRNIRYIDTPIELREKYQYFTQAEMGRLRGEGYTQPFLSLRQGIELYLRRLSSS